jgi:hypothetical protein
VNLPFVYGAQRLSVMGLPHGYWFLTVGAAEGFLLLGDSRTQWNKNAPEQRGCLMIRVQVFFHWRSRLLNLRRNALLPVSGCTSASHHHGQNQVYELQSGKIVVIVFLILLGILSCAVGSGRLIRFFLMNYYGALLSKLLM